MSRELNDSLMRWAAQAGADQLSLFKRGDYMARVQRGLVRCYGRIEGFSVTLRPSLHSPSLPILCPGGDLRIEPVALIRVPVRSGGRLMWAQACQRIGASDLAQEWRFAETTEVRDLLAEMDGYAESPRRDRYAGSGLSARDAIELSPEKGR